MPHQEIEHLLHAWAERTRTGQTDAILRDHHPDAVIFDVLAPLQYKGRAAYRQSWGDWQPETQGENIFALEELAVTAGDALAFAHGLLRCGGTTADGKTFQDLVRATFCLRRGPQGWQITHQHISAPK
jgi:ketosteroid isomerase-like protein